VLKALGMLSAGLAGLAAAVVPLAVAADQGGSSGATGSATPRVAPLRLAAGAGGVAAAPSLPTQPPTIRFIRTSHGRLIPKPGLNFVIR
jgi:hypothetical protein